MNNTWVLVADKGHARFFSVDGPTSPLIEEEDLIIGDQWMTEKQKEEERLKREEDMEKSFGERFKRSDYSDEVIDIFPDNSEK